MNLLVEPAILQLLPTVLRGTLEFTFTRAHLVYQVLLLLAQVVQHHAIGLTHNLGHAQGVGLN